MTAFITGADGFVGAALCDRLRDVAVPLRAVVRGLKSTLDADQHSAVDDTSVETDWTSALQDVTEVVHLAARVHMMSESISDPLSKFGSVNVESTVNLAR